jgi:hypothetical protein
MSGSARDGTTAVARRLAPRFWRDDMPVVFALEWPGLSFAIIMAIALAVALWGPYLYKEIRRGKVQLGPRTPAGAGDTHPGRVGNPAPGQPDAQADPWEPQARR